MKCDELKRKYSDITGPYYGYNEVNEAIAELKARIQLDDDEMAGFLDLEEECGGGDLRNYIAELKRKLEDAKASHYAEMVDAGMRERRLRRELWLTRAMRAHREKSWPGYVEYVHFHENSFYEFDGDVIVRRDNRNNDSFREWNRRWVSVERKCRAKAELYK